MKVESLSLDTSSGELQRSLHPSRQCGVEPAALAWPGNFLGMQNLKPPIPLLSLHCNKMMSRCFVCDWRSGELGIHSAFKCRVAL